MSEQEYEMYMDSTHESTHDQHIIDFYWHEFDPQPLFDRINETLDHIGE